MDKSRVALVRCNSYDEKHVQYSIEKGIDLLGGIGSFTKSGEKIVMKPNVLIGSAPERPVCTHPAVFKAVGRLLKQAGAQVTYGDSSAFGGQDFNLSLAKLKRAGGELGIAMADFSHGKEVVHTTALLSRKLTIANGVLEADGLVSISKLKTHELTRLNGAVKNQFGCVPGLHKREFHFKMPDPFDFATMLVDINTFVKPRLYIMDGIIGMEGNGPYSGKPRQLNLLLLSTDPIALDAVACKVIDLDPEFVPTSKPGEQAGLGTYHYENIDVVGDNLDSFVVKDFEVSRKPPVRLTSKRFARFFKNQLTPKPVVDASLCTGCGLCVKMCPVGETALSLQEDKSGKLPRHDYNRCIRCYCCQETCPEGAISVHTPFFGRLIFPR
jgi:uncharacterized protein (DUF362 family)/Pyruvate/2-oxoacid:ferredoxin oxidoreductase delta subunit